MKKFLLVLAIVLTVAAKFFVTVEEPPVPEAERVDIDLTALSSTMTYSEVFNILQNPAAYRGKTIKLRGTHIVCHDPAKDEYHHACIIRDATACCMQGMEFEAADEIYPLPEEEITLIGRFDTYTIQKIDNPILRDTRRVD